LHCDTPIGKQHGSRENQQMILLVCGYVLKGASPSAVVPTGFFCVQVPSDLCGPAA